MNQSNFSKQLISLITLDVALTIGDSYIPASWATVHSAAALVVFSAMALTMLVAIRRVLADY